MPRFVPYYQAEATHTGATTWREGTAVTADSATDVTDEQLRDARPPAGEHIAYLGPVRLVPVDAEHQRTLTPAAASGE